MQSWEIQSLSGHRKNVAGEKKERQTFNSQGSSQTKENFLDITALIRSLQRSEGENDCFRTSDLSCQRKDCRWRQYCFEK